MIHLKHASDAPQWCPNGVLTAQAPVFMPSSSFSLCADCSQSTGKGFRSASQASLALQWAACTSYNGDLQERLAAHAGISEQRLQEQVIEVVNKADLLPASAGVEAPSEVEYSGASSADTLLLNRSPSGEGPAELQGSEDAAHRTSGSQPDKDHMCSRASLEQHDSTDEGFPEFNTEEGAWGLGQTYDVEPRDINTNIEWLRQQRTRKGASAVMLTSTLTQQGLHELMGEINAMLERRQLQGCVDTEQRTDADGGPTAKGHLQNITHGHHQESGSMASKAA